MRKRKVLTIEHVIEMVVHSRSDERLLERVAEHIRAGDEFDALAFSEVAMHMHQDHEWPIQPILCAYALRAYGENSEVWQLIKRRTRLGTPLNAIADSNVLREAARQARAGVAIYNRWHSQFSDFKPVHSKSRLIESALKRLRASEAAA